MVNKGEKTCESIRNSSVSPDMIRGLSAVRTYGDHAYRHLRELLDLADVSLCSLRKLVEALNATVISSFQPSISINTGFAACEFGDCGWGVSMILPSSS